MYKKKKTSHFFPHKCRIVKYIITVQYRTACFYCTCYAYRVIFFCSILFFIHLQIVQFLPVRQKDSGSGIQCDAIRHKSTPVYHRIKIPRYYSKKSRGDNTSVIWATLVNIFPFLIVPVESGHSLQPFNKSLRNDIIITYCSRQTY